MKVNGKDLKKVSLKYGGHGSGEGRGRCVMEMVALLSGEEKNWREKTDHPICTDPAITEFFITLNDSCPDTPQGQKDRNRLRAFIPRLLQATRGISFTEVKDKIRELVPWEYQGPCPATDYSFMSRGPAPHIHKERWESQVCGEHIGVWKRAEMSEHFDHYLEIADELLDWHEKRLAEEGLMHKIPKVDIEP